MPNMGIEKLYVSQQLTDSAAGMTFTKPQYYKYVQELSLKPKVNSASAYAENRKVDQDTQFDSCDVSINLFQMTSSQRAFMLGQSLAGGGGAIGALNDKAPWITLLYKAPIKVDDTIYYRYGVIYKTQFQPPDDDYKTTEGKPDFSQVPKISGSAQPTEWSFKDGKLEKHPWEWHVDTCDPNCPENIDDTWFNSVSIPSLVTYGSLSLSASSPKDGATGISLDTKPSLTFNNPIMNATSILLYNVSDGATVNTTTSSDSSGKIITITPSTNLVANKNYVLVVQDVTDLYGQTLDTQLIRFTTATAAS
ncbi:major tail protein [Clostridium acetobutylicum]|uniref:Uncharacterized phage related protein n=1 Tax=Clostridium acetobutylicum (strain ATCC 824 / DSM 792 / JCM 1419 / IAM 19013 / LMG 5710 / NBRC 13948 / NRRL B-527 / VKM B-1787 / 2291 / W) TaxID=272562 RepID=Q97HX0_CLOAB|nr:major tail protein [Clostridium acetobutylicum]AAK79850.1 Uncharacterized phage related protein [Clostridium acetobutylicum ATCC 824]